MMNMAGDRERRQHPRFQVGEGAFAFINNIPFSILNVSAGGMKLQSALYDDVPPEHLTLDIFLKNENFYLQDIPVHLVRIKKAYARTPVYLLAPPLFRPPVRRTDRTAENPYRLFHLPQFPAQGLRRFTAPLPCRRLPAPLSRSPFLLFGHLAPLPAASGQDQVDSI